MNGAAPGSTQPVRLELSPSAGFAAWIVMAHAMAAGCLLAVLTGWIGLGLAVLILALGCASAWDRALLRSEGSPQTIEVLATGEALCRFANGESAALEAVGGSAVTRYWVALRLLSPRRRSVFVAAGMLTPEALRLLRLWALWGNLPAVAARQLPAAAR